jgi:hypothetical protein
MKAKSLWPTRARRHARSRVRNEANAQLSQQPSPKSRVRGVVGVRVFPVRACVFWIPSSEFKVGYYRDFAEDLNLFYAMDKGRHSIEFVLVFSFLPSRLRSSLLPSKNHLRIQIHS